MIQWLWFMAGFMVVVVVVGEGGYVRSNQGWGGSFGWLGWVVVGVLWVVVGCDFVEMVNGGLTVRVIKQRKGDKNGREKSIKKNE